MTLQTPEAPCRPLGLPFQQPSLLVTKAPPICDVSLRCSISAMYLLQVAIQAIAKQAAIKILYKMSASRHSFGPTRWLLTLSTNPFYNRTGLWESPSLSKPSEIHNIA